MICLHWFYHVDKVEGNSSQPNNDSKCLTYCSQCSPKNRKKYNVPHTYVHELLMDCVYCFLHK